MGGNAGTTSQIAAFVASSTSFTLEVAVAVAFASTDKYSLIGFKTTGLQPNTVTDRDTFEGATADFTNVNFPNIADDYFQGSKIIWTGGNNAGTTSWVRSYTHSTFTFELQTPTVENIQTSDTFTLLQTCDRSLRSGNGCAKHNNYINFWGDPYKPGKDRIRELPI